MHLLLLNPHVNAVLKSCFFQLRQLSKVKSLLAKLNLETLIHEFIASRLDYNFRPIRDDCAVTQISIINPSTSVKWTHLWGGGLGETVPSL